MFLFYEETLQYLDVFSFPFPYPYVPTVKSYRVTFGAGSYPFVVPRPLLPPHLPSRRLADNYPLSPTGSRPPRQD